MTSPAELRALASRPENIGAMEALLEAAAWIEGVDRLARVVLDDCPHGDGNSCEQYRLQGQRCQDCPLIWEVAKMADDRLARAVLLFHRGSPWTEEDRVLWKELTGSADTTTVVLCDLARSVLVETPELPPVQAGSEAAKRGDAVRVLKAAIVDAARSALVTLPWESVAHVIEETGFQLDEYISR